MKRDDFVSVIGYHGDLALIDKKLKRCLCSKSTQQLIDEGQFKAAFCQSFMAGHQEMELVLSAYNQLSNSEYTDKELQKLFGVFTIPKKVKIQEI